MEGVREDLLKILHQARTLEHSASIKYFTRAQTIVSALMKIEETHRVKGAKEIQEINLRDEKEAIAFYKLIRTKVVEYRDRLQAEFERLEEEIHNVIYDEQEHLKRLSSFVGQLEERVEKKKRFD